MTVGHKARSAAAPTEPYTGAAYLVQGGTAGYSFLELIFALGLIVTVVATATPQLMLTVDDARAAGAARFVAAKLRETRMNAIARSTDVGLEFVSTPSGYTYAAYIDGNGNGIRTAEIRTGVDGPLTPAERLRDRFDGVDLGVLPGLPSVDAGSSPPGGDPIKLGTSNILTFTPSGTSSSGSLYLRGRRDLQYVIRIFGETGKTRVLRFHSRSRQWRPL